MSVTFIGKAPISPEPIALPLYGSPVKAGFPSPADDWLEGYMDLNQLAIKNPDATYMLRVKGDSMVNTGITDGDILIVDCSLEAKHKDIVIACLDGEMTVKRLLMHANGQIELFAENDDYRPIPIKPNDDFSIWGVVKYALKQF